MLFVANAIISTFNIRWDLTPQKQFSLSDFDKRVLAGLTHNVKVMAFVRTEDPAYLELADLLFQAAAYTPRLTYQVIDVNKAPGMAREYGVSSYGEVIVESRGAPRFRQRALRRADPRYSASLVAGQQAHLIYDRSRRARPVQQRSSARLFGMARTARAEQLSDRNVSLFASGVPDDARVIVTLGPQKDFLPKSWRHSQSTWLTADTTSRSSILMGRRRWSSS